MSLIDFDSATFLENKKQVLNLVEKKFKETFKKNFYFSIHRVFLQTCRHTGTRSSPGRTWPRTARCSGTCDRHKDPSRVVRPKIKQTIFFMHNILVLFNKDDQCPTRLRFLFTFKNCKICENK